MSDRDYYEVLGLTPRADGTMVDQAYWHLARKYQALSTTNARGRRLLDELNEAYGVLGNARLRREYDAFRDDVLVGGGVIGPVRSKPKPRSRSSDRPSPASGAVRTLARLRVGAMLALAGVGGIAAAVVLGRPAVGEAALAAVAAIAAFVLLRNRVHIAMPALSMPGLPSLSMPSMPQVSMPEMKAPNLNLAQVGEAFARTGQDEPLDADELHASTAAVIARWRTRMGLTTPLRDLSAVDAPSDTTPSTALVEIVESERELEETESEPLRAVIDILRGAHRNAGGVGASRGERADD
ncbi:MAG: DnaJ domain-containing protein [Dehalococcoidia bacterium]|nr:DnaJ domain-containing protein [Dehalococcoidia bacterium]